MSEDSLEVSLVCYRTSNLSRLLVKKAVEVSVFFCNKLLDTKSSKQRDKHSENTAVFP